MRAVRSASRAVGWTARRTMTGAGPAGCVAWMGGEDGSGSVRRAFWGCF